MQVLTLIDSLIAAGAERMAVNIANGLADSGVGSHLCATRSGGPLEEFIDDRVSFFVAHKKGVLDWKALWGIRRYIKKNKIDLVHAHSSSVFWGGVLKMLTPGLKVVWHDHFGFSEQLDKRPSFWLKKMGRFFDHAFVVNDKLYQYAVSVLKIPSSKVSFLANFADLKSGVGVEADIPDKNLFPKLVCLANLRQQKDHDNLLDAFKLVLRDYPEARLYLVGGHFNDDYYEHLKGRLEQEPAFHKKVFILGSRNDVAAILATCDVGVLSSLSEGLPVSLLEYGMAQLPVVCTHVGDCGLVLDGGRCGELVPAQDAPALARGIVSVLNNQEEAQRKSALLKERVAAEFSRAGAVEKILQAYGKAIRSRGY
jgi:glycosyltransferase involved in cell wall biosynthesis